MGLVKEKMRYFIIPLILLVFVAIYPVAEYNFNCPSIVSDPSANEDCTFTKHMLWVIVSTLSLTEYGFPSDKLFFVEANNPDAYHNHSLIPLAVVTAIVIGVEWVKGRRVTYNFDRETTESFR
tara:strand:+ start:834 stop:1202 length:369 start_codon:yes stop_codon:yes gene_type:complete